MTEPKDLDKIADLIRENTVKFYQLFDSQNMDGLLTLMRDFGLQNFTLSHWVAIYQFDRDSLDAEIKHKTSQSFMKFKAEGDTDKLADSKARAEWYLMLKEQLLAQKSYTIAKHMHGDVERLTDMLRTKISILRKEVETLQNKETI